VKYGGVGGGGTPGAPLEVPASRSGFHTTLLDEFKKLAEVAPRPRTSIEIAGYPHWERVASNLLAFFLDPAEDHGLGNTMAEALIAATGGRAELVDGNLRVSTEVATPKGQRIDLVIESAKAVIVIENKIFADVYNDLGHYAEVARNLATRSFEDLEGGDEAEEMGEAAAPVGDHPGREHRCILLSLKPGDDVAVGRHSFQCLSYADYFDRVLQGIGRPALDAATGRLGLLFDFIRTLEHLEHGSRMDDGFMQFARDNHSDLEDLNRRLRDLQKELRDKVNQVSSSLELPDPPPGVSVKGGVWRDPNQLTDWVYREVELQGGINIEVSSPWIPWAGGSCLEQRCAEGRCQTAGLRMARGAWYRSRPSCARCQLHSDQVGGEGASLRVR